MDYPKCGASNAPTRKNCCRCGAILSGDTVNNVTEGHWRLNSDGTFIIGGMKISDSGTLILPAPVGHLIYEPTQIRTAVFRPISRFKLLLLKWCGFKYEKI